MFSYLLTFVPIPSVFHRADFCDLPSLHRTPPITQTNKLLFFSNKSTKKSNDHFLTFIPCLSTPFAKFFHLFVASMCTNRLRCCLFPFCCEIQPDGEEEARRCLSNKLSNATDDFNRIDDGTTTTTIQFRQNKSHDGFRTSAFMSDSDREV